MTLPTEVSWAEIDLRAIARNARALKRHVGERVALMAVVKANAYGHGAVPVAQTALANGATWLGVHRVAEGIELRSAGIAAPILVLGHALPQDAAHIASFCLIPTVNTLETAKALSKVVTEQGGPALSIHLKVDTGLSRYGLMPQEVLPFAKAVAGLPGLSLQGFWTHFACADEADLSSTRQQLELYLQALQRLQEAGLAVSVRHAANSAATLCLPETHLDLVRCGIALYGLRPSAEVHLPFVLHPAMSLKSRVVRLAWLPSGTGISYGHTHVTSKPTCVALISVGYGDGYHRILSNRGQVLIRGQRAPILGRVCMDQFVVDVSHIEAVQQDDEVVVFGRQGQSELSADEVAAWAGTINYEVVTSILPRVPRVYL
jgi:alanine racemase